MRNETSTGSSHTHQWPQERLAQIEPVISTATPNTIDRWIATYERMSHARSRVRRCWIAISPPAMNPHRETIASGTCT